MVRSRTSSPHRKRLSWLAAALVALTSLGPTLHLATSDHHLCPVHGVEHGDHDHAPHDHPTDVAHHGPDHHGPAGADHHHDDAVAAAHGHAHAHCEAIGLFGHACVSPVPSFVRLCGAVAPAATPPYVASWRGGPSRLHVAPKTSPPPTA